MRNANIRWWICVRSVFAANENDEKRRTNEKSNQHTIKKLEDD